MTKNDFQWNFLCWDIVPRIYIGPNIFSIFDLFKNVLKCIWSQLIRSKQSMMNIPLVLVMLLNRLWKCAMNMVFIFSRIKWMTAHTTEMRKSKSQNFNSFNAMCTWTFDTHTHNLLQCSKMNGKFITFLIKWFLIWKRQFQFSSVKLIFQVKSNRFS